jgi:hypothetical protein
VTYKATAVVAHSFSFPDFTFTMNVSGAVTTADVGKAVALDTGAENTVKLAGADDVVYGRLESVETGGLDGLTVGAVSRKFRAILPTDGTAVAVGDSVCGGATAGTVKAAASDSVDRNTVLAILTGNRAVVEQL